MPSTDECFFKCNIKIDKQLPICTTSFTILSELSRKYQKGILSLVPLSKLLFTDLKGEFHHYFLLKL